MATLANAYVQIVPSMQGVGRAISDAFGSAGNAGGARAGKGFASGLLSQGGIIGAASAVTSKAMDLISSSIGGAVSRVDTMNNFPKVMRNLGYSSQEASEQVKRMSDKLQGLPTSLNAMTGMVQQLAPVTGSLSRATDISLALNDALLAGGKSTTLQANALEQYNQMLAAGKPDLAAWRSVQAAMPGQLDQVAKAMIGPKAGAMDLYKAMKSGTISFDAFNDAIIHLDKEGANGFASFEQQARDSTNGIATSFENLQTRLKNNVAKVIDAFGGENIAKAVNSFSSSFNVIGDSAASTVTFAKGWLGQLDQKLDDTHALDGFRNAWSVLSGTIDGLKNKAVDWVKVQPPDGVASAIKTVSDGLQWVLDHAGGVSAGLGAIAAGYTALKAAQGITGAVNGLSDLAGVIGNVKLDLGEGSGLIGLLSTFSADVKILGDDVGGTVSALGKAAGSISGLASSAGRAGGGIAGLSKALKLGPWGLVAGAIAAVAAGLALFFTQTDAGKAAWSSFTGFLSKAWDGVQGAWDSVLPALGSLMDSLGSALSSVAHVAAPAIKGLADVIGPAFEAIMPIVSVLLDSLVTSLTNVKGPLADLGAAIGGLVNAWGQAFQASMPAISQLLTTLSQTFQQILPPIMQLGSTLIQLGAQILQALAPVINVVMTGILAVMPVITGLVGMIASTVLPIIANLISTVVSALIPVITAIVSAITAMMPVITQVINTVVAVLTPVIQAIGGIIQGVVQILQGVVDYLTGVFTGNWGLAWQGIKEVFSGVWQAITSFLSGSLNAISAAIQGALGIIGNVWNSVWNGLGSFFASIWDGLKNAASNGVNNVLDTIKGIKDKIGGYFSGAKDWLKDSGRAIVQGLIDGIMGMIDNAGKAISSVMDKISSFLPHSPAKEGPFSGHGWTLYSGRAIVDGLSQGIDERSGGLVSSVGALMDQASRQLSSGIGVYGLDARKSVSRAPAADAMALRDGSRDLTHGYSPLPPADGVKADKEVVRAIRDLQAALPLILSDAIPEGISDRDLGRLVRKYV
ncbi:hypothetical protein CRD60_00905 [Bifidobacterium aemilianum]|uniref:Tape measure protein N-terminal domain-containing protein n=1 Tax=Bifidobacterium aemilianum TaxID=2493120 RepID=A0A366K9Q3_9BIFI|nr:tape measure protein [Bifidobacterium aemilianum]RBP98456.1 hypothetical protein CRD60_00905 [Bifidobacterium aemilianum]